MRKNLILVISAVVCILILVWGFVDLAYAKGKPKNWKAIILDDTGNNLRGIDEWRHNGEGWVYSAKEADISTYATIGQPYRTIFHLEFYYPVQVELQGISISDYFNDPELSAGGFDPDFPLLHDFINGLHPRSDQYLKIRFSFYGPWQDTRDAADWENMEIGEVRCMRGWIYINAHNQNGDCSECDAENYHSIDMNTHDVTLLRASQDAWIIDVDTDFNNPNFNEMIPDEQPPFNFYFDYCDFIREMYCVCTEAKPAKGKRPPTYRKETVYPAWGRGNLKFQIKFTTADQ